jgi:phosphodiesterase/alkaline phosphatase D-like protein
MRSLPFASLVSLASLALGAAGCGDDDVSPMDGGTDGGMVVRPDGGPPMCTALPPVVDTGMTAGTDPGIDPSTFEGKTTTLTFDPAAVPESADDFPLGIMAGSMTSSSAMLWTRIGMGADTILRVFRDAETAGDVVVAYEASVTPDANGYVHETAMPLAPATVYHYAFFVDGGKAGLTARSPIGRFRTALADDMALRVTFGATTCTGSAEGYDQMDPADLGIRYVLAETGYPALQKMAALELDALLHLGDMTYNDNAWEQASEMPFAALADIYRGQAGWAFALENEGYRQILPSTGIYNVWDDHEFVDSSPLDDVLVAAQTDADVAMKLEGARDAFYETLPMERGPDGELWRSVRWGETAEIFMLDLRTERDPSTLDTASPRFLSDAQMTWLTGALSASTAHFKLVMTSVNIANLPGAWDVASDDRWEGYVTQREALLDHIVTEGIDNVWFLAGDIHVGFVGRLEPEGTSPWARMWEITVGPGGSADNPLGALLENGSIGMEDVFPCNQFVWGTGKTHVTTTLELDPLANTIHVRFTDALTDEVLFDEVLQQEAE